MIPTRAILLLLAFTYIGEARANPLDMYGSGARGMSLGGAQTAAANDASANYYNPALLATIPDLHVDLEYRFALPKLRLNGQDLGVDVARGTRLAVAMPGHIVGQRMAVGVSVYLPDQALTRIRSLSQTQPRFVLYDNRPQRLFLGVNFAVSVTKNLSIGGGLGYLTATQGTVTLEGRVGFPDANDSDLKLDIDVDVKTLAYPVAGLAYQARPWLRIAASYRGGVQPTTDLGVIIAGDIGAENREPIVADAKVALRSISLSHFQPTEVSLGVDALLTHRLRIAADVTYYRWSEFSNPASRLESSFELGQFSELLDPPEPVVLAATRFHDILQPRIGVEWLALENTNTKWHVRAGYNYEPSPAPEQIAITNFVDNDKHTTAIGVGATIRKPGSILLRPLSLDIGFALTTLSPRNHRKRSPTDRVGDYQSTGSVWQVITTSRMRF